MAHEDEIATVSCGTTKGEVVFEFHRNWSPNGYDRAVKLFERKFFDKSHFFRTVPNFLVQFGISYSHHADLIQFAKTTIKDDPKPDPPIKFTTGTVSYAGSGPDSRTSQLFISLSESGGNFGVEKWETPIGKVLYGIEHVKRFYSQYGDMPPWGHGPLQGKIHEYGEAYIEEEFPKLDRFLECHVLRHQPGDERRESLRHGEQKVAGKTHHQHNIHFNASVEEEGLTKLSWELLSCCLILFLGVLALWLRFVFCQPVKSRKTS